MPHALSNTTESTLRSHARSAEDAAIDWFVRLRARDCNPSEHARFRAWLAADDTHDLAFRRIARLWRRLGRVRDLALEPTARN